MMVADFPCVLPESACVNKQDNTFVCHGSTAPQCYMNWASTDPEDLEPYEEYLAELQRA